MSVASDAIQEFADQDNADFETVFVLADFNCPEYAYLYKWEHRIVGPPVILHCAAKNEVCLLPRNRRVLDTPSE